jgi:hypothetical protein
LHDLGTQQDFLALFYKKTKSLVAELFLPLPPVPGLQKRAAGMFGYKAIKLLAGVFVQLKKLHKSYSDFIRKPQSAVALEKSGRLGYNAWP